MTTISGDRATADVGRQLAAFARPSNGRGAAAIAVNWAIIGCCCYCWPLIDENTSGIVYLAARILELILLTSRIRALESLTHEATHNTLFRTRRLNVALQFLYALPVAHEVQTYAAEHLIHHRVLGQSNDPAQKLFVRHGVDALPRRFWWTMVVRPLLGHHTVDWLHEKYEYFTTSAPYRTRIPIFWISFVALMLIAHRLEWLFLHWLLALGLLFPIVEFWAEVGDHAAISRDAVGRSRSNIGMLHRLLIHTHNDGYHAVHHLSPNIPGHLLPAAHAHLVAATAARERIVEAKSLGATIRHLRRSSAEAP